MPQPKRFHLSMKEVFGELDRVAPGVPLAAFGQTVFWDEPMKRVFLEARDYFGAERPALIGLHDLDYFSRMPAGDDGEYRLLPHNDVDTREIWAAAGELSALFGCETWASRDRLNALGLRLNVALGPELKGLAGITEAWGWRGVVLGAGDAPVVCDLPAEKALPAFRELLEWGAETSAECLAGAERREQARTFGRALVAQLDRAAADEGVRTVSDLLAAILPFMWASLDKAPAPAMAATRTSEVFRFNEGTCGLPRFKLLEIFLAPATAERAREAYNQAVRGAPMYELEEFGAGAVPFDLFVPGRGRGTLFVLDGHVVAHTTPRTVVEYEGRLDVPTLAREIQRQVGPDCALLGKAVSLAAMLAHEFVFVLNETGSAYMPRSAALVEGLNRAGVEYPTHPVVRLRYPTWDSLKAADVEFALPEHLAQAFGSEQVAADEFARRWRSAARGQCGLLRRLKELRGVADILSFLGAEKQEEWFQRLREHQAAEEELLHIQREVNDLKRQTAEIREREDECLKELRCAEKLSGRINEQRLRPLKRQLAAEKDAQERARLQKEIDEVAPDHEAALEMVGARHAERRRLSDKRRETTRAFRRMERSGKAAEARRTLARVEQMAEVERLRLARNAILACEGLPKTDARPAAWWFPLVDPSGKWYDELRRSTRCRLEPLFGSE